MKNYKMIISLIGIWLCVICNGCGKAKGNLIIASETQVLTQAEEAEQTQIQEDNLDAKETVDSFSSTEFLDTEEKKNQQSVCVYICGEVRVPGVYELEGEARVCDAVEAAGGFTENAGQEYWNLALVLTDGQMIYIPTEEEALQYQDMGFGVFGGLQGESQNAMGSSGFGTDSSQTVAGKDGKINLNSADKSLLMTLPGIGESKADSIIAYREECGRFQSIEDVMNVAGIKDGLFQKIKDKITV